MSNSTERSERLLALLLLQTLKGASQKEKIIQLNMAGFSNIEIAELLKTKPTVVAKEISVSQKSGNSRKKRV